MGELVELLPSVHPTGLVTRAAIFRSKHNDQYDRDGGRGKPLNPLPLLRAIFGNCELVETLYQTRAAFLVVADLSGLMEQQLVATFPKFDRQERRAFQTKTKSLHTSLRQILLGRRPDADVNGTRLMLG